MFKKTAIFIHKKIIHLFSGSGIGNLRPVIWLNNFIIKQLRPNYVNIQGNKIYLDSQDSLRLSYGSYEPFETELIKKEVKKGFAVLDIGANIGYYTIMLSKLVGKKGKVFAFEPDPGNIAVLRKNIEVNGCKNVILEQKAVSDKNETIRLYICKYNRGDNRIYTSGDRRNFININAVKLDDYFKDYEGKIDFIKIDIQGAEGLALQGMEGLINKNKQLKITTEFWLCGLQRSRVSAEEYLGLLKRLGFKLFNINEQEGKIELTDAAKLLKEYTLEEDSYTNLFCVRNEI